MFFVTISRQTGSLGDDISLLLAEKLGFPLITREMVMKEWFPEVAGPHELHMLTESPAFYLQPTKAGISFVKFLEEKLTRFVENRSAVIVGLGAQIIFSAHPNALHVRIIASKEMRIRRMMTAHALELKDAERFLELTDRKHRRYIATLYQRDWAEDELYHLTLNTDHVSAVEGAELLLFWVKNKENFLEKNISQENKEENSAIFFKHPSEEEFAKILDMHDLAWQYEPRTFPIEWDAEGNIKMAFSPDFYLPKFDTYIELTTMNQKYVSEKKKKVALLKELYPGTNINIVFRNDFNTLIKRFGLKKGDDNG